MTRALVVDDHESVRTLVTRVLQTMGWEVRTASSGADALREVAGEPVDVLVTDVTLGDMSGLALAEQVRRRSASVGVLVVSGHSPDEVTRMARAEGVPEPAPGSGLRWLSKPFGVSELRAAAGALAAPVADGAEHRPS